MLKRKKNPVCFIKKYDVVQSATSRDKMWDVVHASRDPCHTASKTDFQGGATELPDHVDKAGAKKYYKEISGSESLKPGCNSNNAYLFGRKWAVNKINN